MKKEQKSFIFYIFLILLVIILTFISVKHSNFTPTETTTTVPTSLINDEEYVQNQINLFLQNNPNSNESYARDVVYHDIAIKEKNSSICEKLNTQLLKEDCYNYFKVAR